MEDLEAKALKMAEDSTKEIQKARDELAKEMVDAGMSPDKWGIVDNLEQIIDNPQMPYMCWAELKTKGGNEGEKTI